MFSFLASTLLKFKLIPKQMDELGSLNSFKERYLCSRKTNFWVAETEASNKEKAQIVGTVGAHIPNDVYHTLLNPEDVHCSLELRVST